MRLYQRALAGFQPPFAAIRIHRRDHGYFDVHVAMTEGPGFVRAQDFQPYERLTYEELLDVLAAELEQLAD